MFFRIKKKNLSADEAVEQLFQIVIHNVQNSYLSEIMRGINYAIDLKKEAKLELLLFNYSALMIGCNMLMLNDNNYRILIPKLLDKLHKKIYKFVSDSFVVSLKDFNELTQTRQQEYLKCANTEKQKLGEKIYINLSAENNAELYAKRRDYVLCKMIGVKFFMIIETTKDFFKKNNINFTSP